MMKALTYLTPLLLVSSGLGGPVSAEEPLAAERAVPTKADPNALRKAGYHPLFDGQSLTGWRKVGGTGHFRAEGGTIVGFGQNIRGNTFLRTKKTYADFILIFEFRFEDPAANSGVQFRSQQRSGQGRVFGYQCEHDNNRARAYTAGVYDEARRGWLYPGEFSEAGIDTAFSVQGRDLIRWDGWNTIVIRCRGRHIETWLNGVPRADFKDNSEEHFTAKGFFALQVHGGKSADIRWRNLFVKEL